MLGGLVGRLRDDQAPSGARSTRCPSSRRSASGIEPVLGTEAGDLRKLVAATATTVEALGADTTALQGLVTGARQTLGATNARRAELGELLEVSPPSLDETLVTMRRLRTTLDHLDPLVDDLRPGARALAPAAERRAARRWPRPSGLLRELRPLLHRRRARRSTTCGATADAGVPVMDGLRADRRPAQRRDAAVPARARRRDRTTRNYEAIGPFFSVLNMAAAEYDAIGHRLHLSTPAGSNSVIIAARRSSSRARATRRRRRGAERIGCRRMAHGARARLVRPGGSEVSRARTVPAGWTASASGSRSAARRGRSRCCSSSWSARSWPRVGDPRQHRPHDAVDGQLQGARSRSTTRRASCPRSRPCGSPASRSA